MEMMMMKLIEIMIRMKAIEIMTGTKSMEIMMKELTMELEELIEITTYQEYLNTI